MKRGALRQAVSLVVARSVHIFEAAQVACTTSERVRKWLEMSEVVSVGVLCCQNNERACFSDIRICVRLTW